MFWRIKVETHDSVQFLRELDIVADLETLHQMRLQTIGMPDTPDGGFAQARRGRHTARAPVRGVERFLLGRLVNHLGGAVLSDGARPAGARCVFFQSGTFGTEIKGTPSRMPGALRGPRRGCVW
jgi:hypothetical protein